MDLYQHPEYAKIVSSSYSYLQVTPYEVILQNDQIHEL